MVSLVVLILFLCLNSSLQQSQGTGQAEVVYGNVLTGRNDCQLRNFSSEKIALPEFLQGRGQAQIHAGGGYLAAISVLISKIEMIASQTFEPFDLISVLPAKAAVNRLQKIFQSKCAEQQQQQQQQQHQTICESPGQFISFNDLLEKQSRSALQALYLSNSKKRQLRFNPLDPVQDQESPILIDFWGLVVNKLLLFLEGDKIDALISAKWRSDLRDAFSSLTPDMIDLDAMATWAFATDELPDDWLRALKMNFTSLTLRGKILFLIYLKNQHVTSSTRVTPEFISFYQSSLKIVMDRIRIDPRGNTAFLTTALTEDGVEEADYQATAMLLLLITKFTPYEFDAKPRKMANFLAAFGRQGDFRFPIENFKNFQDPGEALWALVALSLREVSIDVDVQLKVIASGPQEGDQIVLAHEFKSCCDVFVKKLFPSLSELMGGKTVSFSVCGSGDVSVSLQFLYGNSTSQN